MQVLSTVRATCSALPDGLRHQDIMIHIGSQQETMVLTRAEAGERGEPYRKLAPRAQSQERPALRRERAYYKYRQCGIRFRRSTR